MKTLFVDPAELPSLQVEARNVKGVIGKKR